MLALYSVLHEGRKAGNLILRISPCFFNKKSTRIRPNHLPKNLTISYYSIRALSLAHLICFDKIEAAPMAKPWKILDLNPDESLKQCLHKIALTRIQETFSYESATVKGEDLEALHDMRVSARRLRAVLRIFRDCFSKEAQETGCPVAVSYSHFGRHPERDVFWKGFPPTRKVFEPADRKVIDLSDCARNNLTRSQRRNLMREIKFLTESQLRDFFCCVCEVFFVIQSWQPPQS